MCFNWHQSELKILWQLHELCNRSGGWSIQLTCLRLRADIASPGTSPKPSKQLFVRTSMRFCSAENPISAPTCTESVITACAAGHKLLKTQTNFSCKTSWNNTDKLAHFPHTCRVIVWSQCLHSWQTWRVIQLDFQWNLSFRLVKYSPAIRAFGR